MKRNIRITLIGVGINIILFIMKLAGGLASNSLALMSDSFNSFTDILASVAIFFAVRLGAKSADIDHPFGHQRAEPIAALLTAILAAILGFEVVKNAVQGLYVEKTFRITPVIFIVITITIVLKLYVYIIFLINGRRSRSPALLASSVDYRNDVFISVSVLVGNILIYIGYPVADSIVALCIGIFIIYSGLRIGTANVDYLMGKKPSDDIMEKLKAKALSISGVKALNEVKAHYIGTIIQVEIHIEVEGSLSTLQSHAIAKEVQNRLEQDETVDYAFVHIDPV